MAWILTQRKLLFSLQTGTPCLGWHRHTADKTYEKHKTNWQQRHICNMEAQLCNSTCSLPFTPKFSCPSKEPRPSWVTLVQIVQNITKLCKRPVKKSVKRLRKVSQEEKYLYGKIIYLKSRKKKLTWQLSAGCQSGQQHQQDVSISGFHGWQFIDIGDMRIIPRWSKGFLLLPSAYPACQDSSGVFPGVVSVPWLSLDLMSYWLSFAFLPVTALRSLSCKYSCLQNFLTCKEVQWFIRGSVRISCRNWSM